MSNAQLHAPKASFGDQLSSPRQLSLHSVLYSSYVYKILGNYICYKKITIQKRTQDHSSAWIIQTWLSFIIAISTTAMGIIYLPVNGWIKGYMGMGLIFTVGSTISLTKTQRDLHEAEKLTQKIEEARVEKILSEHDSYK